MMGIFYGGLIGSLLSSLSSLLILICCIKYKHVRDSEVTKYVMLLLACDFGISLAYFIPPTSTSNQQIFKVQGFLMQFFSITETLSFACIT